MRPSLHAFPLEVTLALAVQFFDAVPHSRYASTAPTA